MYECNSNLMFESINAPPPPPPPSPIVANQDCSFYGKRFKKLEVNSRIICSKIACIFFNFLSFCCAVVGANNLRHRYKSLAEYYSCKASTTSCAYRDFGDRIINFTINKPKFGIGTRAHGLELESFFPDLKRKIEIASTEEIPILHEKLEWSDQGICLGMSIDFIREYLNDFSIFNDSLKTIKYVSQRYTEGASKEAHITQMIFHAQDLKGLESIFKETEIQMNSFKIAMTNTKDIPEKKMLVKCISQIASESKRRMNEWTNSRYQSIGNLHNLKVSLLNNVSGAEIVPFLKELPAGTYLGCFHHSQENSTNHAIAMIKASNGECFVQDPNFATVQLRTNELFQQDWNSLADPYQVKGLSLFQCSKGL